MPYDRLVNNWAVAVHSNGRKSMVRRGGGDEGRRDEGRRRSIRGNRRFVLDYCHDAVRHFRGFATGAVIYHGAVDGEKGGGRLALAFSHRFLFFFFDSFSFFFVMLHRRGRVRVRFCFSPQGGDHRHFRLWGAACRGAPRDGR